MTDAHCHVTGAGTRHFLCAVSSDGWAALSTHAPDDMVFYGIHPWVAATATDADFSRLREILSAEPTAGVGEIGLDRLREREIPSAMTAAFERQLEIAAEFARPVQLHGAKCWGRVVAACSRYAGRIPAFLFHAFSRSGGLLPEMIRIGGYVTVGPAVLNDHATNYRELVRQLPIDRLLVESDRTTDTPGVESVDQIAASVAALRGLSFAELSAVLEANAARFRTAGGRTS